MTNILYAYLLATLVTNWTGAIIGTNEVGIVVTNYEAVVIEPDTIKTHKFLLRSEPSSIAVWRSAPPPTNYWFQWPGTQWLTNIYLGTNYIETKPTTSVNADSP